MLLLYLYLTSHLFMAISSQSCGPRVSARLLAEIPCDMSVNSFCTQPGSAYPWAPLRRYIVENQGSLKRMYGEFRQSNVVQEEIDRFSARYANLDSNTFTEFEIRKARNSNGFVVDAVEEKTGSEETFTSILASTTSTTSAPSTTTTSGSTSSSTTSSVPTSASPSSTESPTTTTPTSAQSPEPETTQSPIPEAVYVEEEEEESSTHVLNFDDVLTGRDQLPAEPDNTLPEGEEKENVPKEEPKGYPACPIAQEVVAPYWANNTRGETLALLNVYPFEQYIHWEKCAHEGEQMFCREGCKCEQQYRLHRLLAFDPKSECRGIFADWFRFPGSCACVCYDSLPDRINSRKARL